MKKTLILPALALVAASSFPYIQGGNRQVGINSQTTFNNKEDVFDMNSSANQKLDQSQESIMRNFTAKKTTDNIFKLGETEGDLSAGNGRVDARDGHIGAGHQLGGHMVVPSFESAMGFSQGNSGGQSIGNNNGSAVSGSMFAFGPAQVHQSDKSVTNLRGDVEAHEGDRNMYHTDNSKFASTLMRDNHGDDQETEHKQ